MISDPQSYLKKLQEIQNSNLDTIFLQTPDEPRLIINANTRTITVPNAFKYVGVEKDHNAETIFFEVDRYFDNEDLSKHTCVIHYINAKKSPDVYPVTLKDLSVDGKLFFGWKISNHVTELKGAVVFAIRFYTLSSDGTTFDFNLNTTTASFGIQEGLDVMSLNTQINSDLLSQSINQLNKAVASANLATQSIKADAITAKSTIDNAVLTTRMIYKEPVSSFSALTTTYPNAEEGWVSKVLGDSKIYRYTNGSWQWRDTVSLSTYDALFSSLTSKLTSTTNKADTVALKADAMSSGSPKGVYATLALLQTAFPTGTEGAYLVTADGNWYYWNGSAWTAGGTYQSTGIAKKSITYDNTNFVTIGKNLYDKSARTISYDINHTNGVLSATAIYDCSDYIQISAGVTYYINKCRKYVLFNTSKAYLSGVSNTSYGSVTITPAQDGYVRFTVGQDFVDTTQMEVGSAPTNYEKYSFVIDKLKVTLPEKSVTEKEINDGAITPNKTNFFVIGKNKFNIATITSGGFYQLNGTFTANILYFYSDLISVVEGKTYIFSGDSGTIGVRALLIMSFVSCYKDGIIVPVSDAVGRNVSQITIPTGVNQIRISSIVEYLTRNIQVELGSIITDFEDYRKIIDNRYLPDKATQIEKVSYTILAPKKLYTVYDDIHTSSSDAKQRKTALPVYIDYMIPEQTDILAKNGWDKFILEDYNDGGRNNLNTSVPATVIDRKFEFKSDKYNVNPIIIQQVATKMTAPTDKSFVLTIGDSVTEAGRSNYLYYMSATEYFEKEAIDRGTTNNVKFIGARTIKKFTLDYLGSTLNLKACAEGRSGWTLHNYMRHTNNLVTNQTTWDNMGLGNSSHTDYIGSDAQNELIRKTCMVDSKETVENFFFNNAKTGTNRFSINKWLERYRTLDDNGNRLILGNGTGTQITASNLTEMDVCTPTHIVIAMGHNDMENNYKGTPDEFHTNIQEIITAIRAELPNVIILLVATPPLIGTWHEELYQNYLFTNGVIRPYNTQKYMDNVRWMVSYCDANESNGIYLLPQYFVTPTCNAMSTVKQTDGIGNVYYQPYAAGGLNAHPNENANRIWGYQLYSQLKYLMTL